MHYISTGGKVGRNSKYASIQAVSTGLKMMDLVETSTTNYRDNFCFGGVSTRGMNACTLTLPMEACTLSSSTPECSALVPSPLQRDGL